MSEKISSNRDIRKFFQTNSKENSLNIPQTKQKMSREPLFELQPSLDLEKSPSPPRLEKMTSSTSRVHESSNCQKLIKSEEDDSDSIPELDQVNPTTILEETKPKNPKKRKKKKPLGGSKKRCKKEKLQNLDLGPNEFSDESSDHEIKIKKLDDNKVKDEVKKEEVDKKEDEEEYDVEKILDYKWCLATVSRNYYSRHS